MPLMHIQNKNKLNKVKVISDYIDSKVNKNNLEYKECRQVSSFSFAFGKLSIKITPMNAFKIPLRYQIKSWKSK